MQKARRHPNGTPTACRHTVSGSISLRCSRFFSPFPHGTGTLSVSQEYLALPDGAGGFPQGVSDPAVLRIPLGWLCLRVRDYHPLRSDFPIVFLYMNTQMSQSYNPGTAETIPVWAISTSLATTTEITLVFSSCAYLDVSVQRVRLLTDGTSSMCRVSPFRNQRINRYLLLPVAYRSLSRLSSPLRA